MLPRATTLSAVLIALFAAPAAPAAPAAALAGPPWIAIEYPVNPYDSSMRGAFLLVHAFHHGRPVGLPVEGTAEGLVNGQRRSMPLEFSPTSRAGVYALKRLRAEEGVWTLVIRVIQESGDRDGSAATAVVELGADGAVASVKVPTVQRSGWTVPARVSPAEIDTALRARAASLAQRS